MVTVEVMVTGLSAIIVLGTSVLACSLKLSQTNADAEVLLLPDGPKIVDGASSIPLVEYELKYDEAELLSNANVLMSIVRILSRHIFLMTYVPSRVHTLSWRIVSSISLGVKK